MDFCVQLLIEKQNKNLYLLILADSGVGKTTLMQYIFKKYVQHFPQIKLAFIYCGENTDSEIDSIDDKKNTILLLDALDEDIALRKDFKTRLINLNNKLFHFDKVIVSTRTQLFVSRTNEWLHLRGKTSFESILLDQFTKKEAKKYLSIKYSSDNSKRERAFRVFDKNPSFFKRPLLLSYFDDLLDETKFEYNYQVFEHLVKKWSEREAQNVDFDRISKRSYERKLINFSKELAYLMYQKQRYYFKFFAQDIVKLLKDNIDIKNLNTTGKISDFIQTQTLSNEKIKLLEDFIKEYENITCIELYDILAFNELVEKNDMTNFNAQVNSLLKRDTLTDHFLFTHQSFYDYFVGVLIFEGRIKEEEENYNSESEAFYLEMCKKDFPDRKKVNTELLTKCISHFDNYRIMRSINFYSKHFGNFTYADYSFKVAEKLKDLDVKHYIIDEDYKNFLFIIKEGKHNIEQNKMVSLFLKDYVNFIRIELRINPQISDDSIIKRKINQIELKNLELEHLIDEIQNFQSLSNIDLSINPNLIYKGNISILSNIRSIKYLNLDCNRITKIPLFITELDELKTLILSRNQIEKLPASIKKLQKLQNLVLWDNRLISLPSEINLLKFLHSIYLGKNTSLNLDKLFKVLKDLESLMLLDLGNSKISKLPNSVTELQTLVELDLSNNSLDLDDIIDKIKNLGNLKKLNLMNCHLNKTPKNIENLESLQELNLVGNSFSNKDIKNIKSRIPNCNIVF